MPTYDYECRKCGHVFEAFQSITEEPLSKCPKCKGAVKRMVGGGMGVIFKGSGFYSTDNKKSSSLSGANGGSKDKKSESGSDSSSGSAKESSSASSSSSSSTTSSTEKKPAS
jgi:putative FmdB family regulatory protein